MKNTTLERWTPAIWVVLWLGVCPHAELAQEHDSRRLSVDVARRLVLDAVKAHNPGATVSQTEKSPDPDFYFFDATWPNPKGSPLIGYFAVNPWTGDVWDYGACKRLDLPSLRRLQDEVRKSSGIAKRVRADLRNKRPVCIEHGQK